VRIRIQKRVVYATEKNEQLLLRCCDEYIMLILTDGAHEIRLTDRECIDLELKLNVSAYGKLWSHIGAELYEYGCRKFTHEKEFLIEKEELIFLNRLLNKATWEQCQGMK